MGDERKRGAIAQALPCSRWRSPPARPGARRRARAAGRRRARAAAAGDVARRPMSPPPPRSTCSCVRASELALARSRNPRVRAHSPPSFADHRGLARAIVVRRAPAQRCCRRAACSRARQRHARRARAASRASTRFHAADDRRAPQSSRAHAASPRAAPSPTLRPRRRQWRRASSARISTSSTRCSGSDARCRCPA